MSATPTEAARRVRGHPLHGVGLLVGVALFLPGVGVKVIAADLPESRSVDFEELERANPLGALPEVKLRNDEAARAPVLGFEALPVVPEGEEDVVVPKVRERDVGRVALLAVNHHGDRLRPDAHATKDFWNRDALPPIVEPTPARHAMNVGRDFDPRQVEEFLPRPGKLFLDQAEASKRPGLQVDPGRGSVREHGPLFREHLTGRQALARLRLDHLRTTPVARARFPHFAPESDRLPLWKPPDPTEAPRRGR